jgi:uncharacterized protein HemY
MPARDPQRAVALARRYVDERPESVYALSTLGMACYRAGDWKGSAEALRRMMVLGADGDPSDWFVLAMAQ